MNRKVFFLHILKHWFLSPNYIRRSIYLTTVLILTAFGIYMQVYLTQWHNAFIQSMSDYSYENFLHQLKIFFPIVIVFLLLKALQGFLVSHLGFEWRKSTVYYFQNLWLSNVNYYRLTTVSDYIDNPDQRITQDIVTVTANSLQLMLLFAEKVTSLIVFSFILWDYSKLLTITLAQKTYVIPGLLFWLALIYCVFGTLFACIVGKNIVPLTIAQEKREATFRYYLIRLSENAQSIAMSRGEKYEASVLRNAFVSIETNFYQLLKEMIKLDWYTNLYSNVSSFVPMLIVGPFYFLKMLTLGTLMQINDIFKHVYDSLSQIVFNYKEILRCLAALTRLYTFHDLMSKSSPVLHKKGNKVYLKNICLLDNNNEIVCNVPDMDFSPGVKILIRGSSGSGKSTLLRLLAGLHDSYTGDIVSPDNSIYLPSMLYLPIGTLEEVLPYPHAPLNQSDSENILDTLQLSGFKKYLATNKYPEKLLSMGERQRLILARLFLQDEVNWFFLDEPTSHLNELLANDIMQKLLNKHPNAGFIIISHDLYPSEWFDYTFDLKNYVQ